METLRISDTKRPRGERLDLKRATVDLEFCVRPILNHQDLESDEDGPRGFVDVDNAKISAVPCTGGPWGVALELRSPDEHRGFGCIRMSESQAEALREMLGHAIEVMRELRGDFEAACASASPGEGSK